MLVAVAVTLEVDDADAVVVPVSEVTGVSDGSVDAEGVGAPLVDIDGAGVAVSAREVVAVVVRLGDADVVAQADCDADPRALPDADAGGVPVALAAGDCVPSSEGVKGFDTVIVAAGDAETVEDAEKSGVGVGQGVGE